MTDAVNQKHEFDIVDTNKYGGMQRTVEILSQHRIPTVLSLILHDEKILTYNVEKEKRQNKASTYLPEATVLYPFSATQFNNAIRKRFNISSDHTELLSSEVIVAKRVGTNSPRLYIPTVMEVDTNPSDKMFPAPTRGQYEWLEPELALDKINYDDSVHGINGSQRRDIARFTLELFLEKY